MNEKEKINFENNLYNRKKNVQSKHLFINNILKNENYIVYKYIKTEKTNEKKSRSKNKKIKIKKQKNRIINVNCHETDLKIRKKLFDFSKNEKNREQKKEENNNLEEDNF